MTAQPNPDPRYIELKPEAAKRLARGIWENGVVEFSAHAREELKKDDLQTTDCQNLLRGGVWEAPELEKNELRYRVSTQKMCIVVVFRSVERLRIVTAWRKR